MNVYQIVTDRIIQQLKQGTVPWHKPWYSVTNGAYNRITGRRYSLLNQMLLRHDGEYASYNQWAKLGGQVRKGEKAEMVVFWKPQTKDPGTDDASKATEAADETKWTGPVLKYYYVFHISQVDGVEPDIPEPLPGMKLEPIVEAELILHNYLSRERITFKSDWSDQAYYSPAEDLIHIPKMEQFDSEAGYYSTAFHEAAHSTGIERRLNRPGLKNVRFGSENYSKEELIAELSAASMINSLGLETDRSFQNSAAYIYGWLEALKSDARLVVSAAGQAEKCVRYILDTREMQHA